MLRHNAISDVDFFIEQVPINKWTNYLIFGVKKFDSKIGTSRKKVRTILFLHIMNLNNASSSKMYGLSREISIVWDLFNDITLKFQEIICF